jgi:hypothetical protein
MRQVHRECRRHLYVFEEVGGKRGRLRVMNGLRLKLLKFFQHCGGLRKAEERAL